MRSCQPLGASLLALLLPVLSGCCLRSVEESVTLAFPAKGGGEIRTSVRLPAGDDCPRDPEEKRRLEARREELLRQEDDWSRAIRAAAPDRSRVTFDEAGGRLVEASRQAELDDPSRLEAFLREIGLPGLFRLRDGAAQLEIAVPASGRATAAEKKRFDEGLDRFSTATEAYLRALAALWRALDRNPAAAPAAIAELLGEGDAPLPDDISPLVEEAARGLEGLVEVAAERAGTAESLDELADRASNAIPARLAIEVEGTVTESEGLVLERPGRWAVPERRLSSAIERLEGRWVSPDPAALVFRSLREAKGGAPDLAAFSALPRAVRSVPGREEIRRAILDEIRPPSSIRIAWSRPALPAPAAPPR